MESLDDSSLTAADRQQFMEEISGMGQQKFFFQRGVEFVEGNREALSEYAAKLAALQSEAANFDYTVSVTVKGSADTVGDADANARLADRRAEAAASVLALSGVQARIITQAENAFANGPSTEDVEKRSVEVSLRAEQMPARP